MNKDTLLNHHLVPKHEILSKKEGEKILEKYGVTPEKLPAIKENDPVAKAIEAKEGQILKITRESPTAGKTHYYRLVSK